MSLPVLSHADTLSGLVELALRFVVDRVAHLLKIEIGEGMMSTPAEHPQVVHGVIHFG